MLFLLTFAVMVQPLRHPIALNLAVFYAELHPYQALISYGIGSTVCPYSCLSTALLDYVGTVIQRSRDRIVNGLVPHQNTQGQ